MKSNFSSQFQVMFREIFDPSSTSPLTQPRCWLNPPTSIELFGDLNLFAQRIARGAFISIIALLRDLLPLTREGSIINCQVTQPEKNQHIASMSREASNLSATDNLWNRFSLYLLSGYVNWFKTQEFWLGSLFCMMHHHQSTRVLIN